MPIVLGLMDAKIEWNEAESSALADGHPYIGLNSILESVFARIVAYHDHFGLEDAKTHGTDDSMAIETLRYDAKVKATEKTITHKLHISGH